ASPAVRREIVRGPFPSFFKGMAFGGGEATVVKFTLPAGADAAGKQLVLKSTMAMNAVEVWRDGNWQPLDGFFNGVNGVVVFGDGKRAIIQGGFGNAPADAVARRLKGLGAVTLPAVPSTTMPVQAPGGKPASPVPTTAPAPAPPPMIIDRFDPGMVGVGGTSEIILPDGLAQGGVVFLRFTLDPNMVSPDGILTLGEAS
ncbi:MAG: hypothetical protein ACRDZ7_14805, partial [Acidimicrobiia bacterium]